MHHSGGAGSGRRPRAHRDLHRRGRAPRRARRASGLAGGPQRFLAAWATRDAAGWRLADVVLDLEEERLLRPLGVKPLGLHATSAERLDHARELTVALDAHRQRRTWSGALRQRFRRVARHPIWRLTENRRAPRRRPRATRRARTRSPDPDRSDLSSRRLCGARAGERHSSFARIGYPPSRRWLNWHVGSAEGDDKCRSSRAPGELGRNLAVGALPGRADLRGASTPAVGGPWARATGSAKAWSRSR